MATGEKRVVEDPIGSEQRIVASLGGRLAVTSFPGAGEPVLLLHGGPGCPDYLEPVARLLAPTHRAITFHQRGVGPSEALDGRYGLHAYLADIEAIRASFGIDRWHVFGHSWGGVLAQLYARAHPDRLLSLFLADAALGVGNDWRRTRRAVLGHMLRTAGFRTLVEAALGYLGTWLPGRLGKASARRLFRHIWRIGFPDPRRAEPPDEAWLDGVDRRAVHRTHWSVLATPAETLPRRWPDPPWPVFVLYGRSDIFGDAADVVRARFPTATQVRVDAAHFPWLQAPAEFQRMLSDFYGSSVAVLREPRGPPSRPSLP